MFHHFAQLVSPEIASRMQDPLSRFRRPAMGAVLPTGAAVCLTLAGAGLGGCRVDQAKEVRLYRDVVDLDVDQPIHHPGDPLNLQQAVRLTNAYNERISIEGENYLQAMIDRYRRSSSLFPTLDLFGDLIVRDSTGSGTNTATTVFDAGLGAQYTLMTGATDFNRVKASEATIEERRWLLLDLREALLLETAQVYYAVLRAERLARVLESSSAVQDERLRDIRGRQDAGFARPLDVAQIEAQASETRVALLDARNQITVARSTLTFLTGAEMATSPLTDEFALPSERVTLEQLIELALRSRQDLAAAEASTRAARAEVDAEIGRYYPTVTVNLDYFLTRESVPTDRDWSGLLTLNLPLFTAGRIDADVREAWSIFRQHVLRYSLIRRQIRRDVEVAYEDYMASGRRLAELQNQLRAAEEALRQAEASYQAGLGTNLERVAAQDQLLSAQVSMTNEEFIRKLAYLSALRAIGALTSEITQLAIPSPADAPAPIEPHSPFLNLPGGMPAPKPTS